ncbi:TonB-dependent receptor [Chroococcidiopsis sp. CCALA 051]|uniref:TonB-dependent receptor domain-containing protein n=1 Tax=Chroococcidiopsis sp. CCALA 051 TaxID=869949 RepID=UPI000D0CAFAD|nr:TonB-dependent receptor [Chroococcidiopsis sp. CCALA 051]PSM48980.1 TonB-dependent receptor [Chroococcidiopsis sp. CCALA 051]
MRSVKVGWKAIAFWVSLAAVMPLWSEPVFAQVKIIRVKTIEELPPVSFSAKELLAQEGENSTITQVTGVRLNPTTEGLQVILVTPLEQKLQPSISSVEKNLVIDLPNAVLTLPDRQEFTATNPTAEIAQVTVKPLNASSIRVTITGSKQAPNAEVVPSKQGLVLNVSSQATAQTEASEMEVVVTATRTEERVEDLPRTVTVIDREEIEAQATGNNSLQDILNYSVPGYGAPDYTDRFNANLRGRTPQILVDGVPLGSNVSNITGLTSIDPNTVERIEVVNGATGIYGAGGSGGVVNIITRQPIEGFESTARLGVSAALGNLEGDSFAYELGYGIAGTEGIFDYNLNLATQFNNQFYDPQGDIIRQENSTFAGSERLNLLGKLGIALGEEQRLQFSVNHASDRREINYITDPITREIPDRQKIRALRVNQDYVDSRDPGNQNTIASVAYDNRAFLGNNRLQAQFSYLKIREDTIAFDYRGTGDEIFDGVYRFMTEGEVFNSNLQVETSLFQNAKLLVGADYKHEDNRSSIFTLDTEAYDASGGDIIQVSDEFAEASFSLSQLGLFAQIIWDVTDNFSVLGGIRQEFAQLSVDDYTTFEGDSIRGGDPSFDATVFNIGATFKATDNISLFANFAQGFSNPGFFVLNNLPDGSSVDRSLEDIQPQIVDSYEIGIRGQWQNLQAYLAAFYSSSELGSFFQEVAEDVFETIRAPERRYGIEAAVDWQLAETWKFGVGGNWTEGEFEDENGEFIAADSISVNPWKLTAYVEHQTTPNWRNRLQILYSGDRDRGFESGLDQGSVDDYATLDLISTLSLGEGTLSLSVENLLNEEYSAFPTQSLTAPDEDIALERGRRVSLTYSISW